MPETNLSTDKLPIVVVITGPTASGKSRVAVEVAKALKADIISADSRQIYSGIPITTAAPTPSEKEGVTHHLLEILELKQTYSAALFADDAMRIIEERGNAGDRYVVVCGGSMMYIDALLYGLNELPTISDSVRQRVAEMTRVYGMDGLLAYLEIVDPEYFASVDKNNPRRIMHAVELYLQSGVKVSDLFKQTDKTLRPFSFFKFALNPDREEMFERINRRVRSMVEAGMEEEARSVLHLRHLNSLNTIGFKEWFDCFDGKMDRETTIDRIAKNTRVYAKKQLTWLAKSDDTIFVRPENAVEQIIARMQ